MTIAERFSPWLKAQEDAAAITDATGRLVASNDLLLAIFNLPSMSSATSPLLQDLLFQEQFRSENESTCRTLESILTSNSSGAIPTQISVAFDEQRILEVTLFPQINRAGVTQVWLWLIRDASDGHRLREHQEHVERMQTISRFAGGMAHEFNNLLTAILGNLELLRASPDLMVRDVLPYVESAEVASLRASQLIHELRMFASRDVPHREVQSIAPVVRKVQRLLSGIAPERIRISQEFDCDEEPFASINAPRLEDALLKLGLNAIEAINEGHGAIHLRLSRSSSEESGSTVSISVIAFGVDVSDGDTDIAFEPFSADGEGNSLVSLGMAMAYGLVEEMDGTLTCSNSGRQRICVTLTLPASAQPEFILVESDSDFTRSPRTLSVAVVDSESSVRKVARGMLRLLGHQPTSFDSGVKFLDAIKRGWEFDLVLLDSAMPELSGRNTYERFRTMVTDVPVVICSGRTIDLKSFCPASDQPPNGFLSKPFSIADLSAAVAPYA